LFNAWLSGVILRMEYYSTMNEKKVNWMPVKEMLFTYLAISKILYWFSTITALGQEDLGRVWLAVLERFLSQDILIILGVIFFFFLDKYIQKKRSIRSKSLENFLFYGIGGIVLLSVSLIYALVMSLFFAWQIDIGWFISSMLAAYIVVTIVLNLKDYFKSKASPDYALSEKSTDDKLKMLEVLHSDGILTQEEFVIHREALLSKSAKSPD